MLSFDWDEDKRFQNVNKHKIDFFDAVNIFYSPYIEIEDTRKDYGEKRIIVIGLVRNIHHVVVYTPRGDEIRLISARRADEREKEKYERKFGKNQN